MHSLMNVFLYCGRSANKAGNNLRTTTYGYAHNAQTLFVKNLAEFLYTYFEHRLHTVLHTKFLQFISVNGGYAHQSTGPTTITILYK